jgi:hypothetical protein
MADEAWTKYRILSGKHVQRDRDGISRTYVKGDVFECPARLMARLQPAGVPQEKFTPADPSAKLSKGYTKQDRMDALTAVVAGEVTTQPALSTEQISELRAEFETLTVAQLQGLASDEEIDVAGLKKAEIIDKLLRAKNAV